MDGLTVKKILVPTDFSETSERAIDTAIDVAKVFHADIELVHVFVEPTFVLPPPVEMATFPFDMAEIMTKVQKHLDGEQERVRATGVPCKSTTLTGRAAPEIVDYAKEISADMIVMGTHGRGGFEHALLGSVAERVVHHTPCPVLVVPSIKSAR